MQMLGVVVALTIIALTLLSIHDTLKRIAEALEKRK